MGQLFPLATFPYKPAGFASLSVTAVTPLAPPVGARGAIVQAHGGNVSWRDDATPPSATVGMLLIADAEPTWFSGDMNAVQFIAVTGTTTTILVSYYK